MLSWYIDILGSIVSLPHMCRITGLRSGGFKQMARANYLFNGLGDKADRLTCLAPSRDAGIK